MKTLGNWTIRGKSIVILGGLSGLVLTLGLLSYFLLSSTNREAEDISGNWLPSMKLAAGSLRIFSSTTGEQCSELRDEVRCLRCHERILPWSPTLR